MGNPPTAATADLLYDRVLPFYEALVVPVGAVLTDNGREFCGRSRPTPTSCCSPQGHRATPHPDPLAAHQRLRRTTQPHLLDECFRVAGRTTWYTEASEIQADLDRFLACYNLERSYQGYRLKGRTPTQALRDALGVDELPPLVPVNDHEEEHDDEAEPEAA